MVLHCIPSVGLDGHDKPKDQQSSLYHHELCRTRLRGATSVKAGGKHAEETKS